MFRGTRVATLTQALFLHVFRLLVLSHSVNTDVCKHDSSHIDLDPIVR